MANVKPMDREEVGELEPFMNMAEAAMGFLPNSIMTMSHMRQLVPIFSLFVATVRGADAKALMNAIGPQIPDMMDVTNIQVTKLTPTPRSTTQ